MYGFPLLPSEPRGIPLNFTLLPEHLKKIGYVTRMIGKWHTGYHTVNHTPARRGFDSFFGYYNGCIKYFQHTIRYSVSNSIILVQCMHIYEVCPKSIRPAFISPR